MGRRAIRSKAARNLEKLLDRQESKDPDDRIANARQLYEVALRRYGPESDATLHHRSRLALRLYQADQFDEAVLLWRQCLATATAREDGGGKTKVDIEYGLAAAARGQGDWDTATLLATQVYNARRVMLGEDDEDTLRALKLLDAVLDHR